MKDRIKEIRRHPKINLSQEAFGNRLGITGSSVSLLESGRNQPSDQTILLICREYGVNETWLRTGAGEMFIQTAEDEIRKIGRSRGLDDDECDLLQNFVDLHPEDRRTLIRIIRQLAGRTAKYSAQQETPRYPQDMTEEELHAELDRQLAEEKRQRESASASGRGNSGLAVG